MKYLTGLILLSLIFLSGMLQAQCTSISRTNSSALSVLTSTKYNSDLNTVYTAVNAFDGGCITDGTLESTALNTSDFAPLLKGLKEGCKVQYSNASTINISECLASVNGNFVTTTTNTSASFGCTGCSAEVATTSYYVYIQTGSSGSTLTPLILTGAPNDDGYDGSGNKVLGRFFNNTASDISATSIDQWNSNQFIPTNIKWTSYTPTLGAGFGTVTGLDAYYARKDDMLYVSIAFTLGTAAASLGSFSLPEALLPNENKMPFVANASVIGKWETNGADTLGTVIYNSSSNLITIGGSNNSVNMFGSVNVSSLIGTGAQFQARFSIPITDYLGGNE